MTSKSKLSPADPAHLWAVLFIQKKFETLWSYHDRVHADPTADDIHDMRVASRRLRAVLKDFRPFFPKKYYRPLAELTRNLTRKLGRVRDQDILAEHLQTLTPKNKTIPLVQSILRSVRKEKTEALAELHQYMDKLKSVNYPQLFKDLLHYTKKQRVTPTEEKYTKSLYYHMRSVLFQRLADLYAWEKSIFTPDCWHELHQMRIAAKQLRYSMELYAPCFDKIFTEEYLQKIKMVQEHLGQIQDQNTFILFLKKYYHPLSPTIKKSAAKKSGMSDESSTLQSFIQSQETIREKLYHEFILFWNELHRQPFYDQFCKLIFTTFQNGVAHTADLNFMEKIFIDDIFSPPEQRNP